VRRDDKAIEGLGEAIVDILRWLEFVVDVADHLALSCM
jgi:hypothetical protein